MGGTTVHCSATDTAGNTGLNSFSVYVKNAYEQTFELRALVNSWTTKQNQNVYGKIADDLQHLEGSIQGFYCVGLPGKKGSFCPAPCPTLQEVIADIQRYSTKLLPAHYSRLTTDTGRLKSVLACTF
jgi:hypothetical protein